VTPMTKAALVDRLTAVTAAIADFPATIPPITAVYVHGTTVSLGLDTYSLTKPWQTTRRVAELAEATNATLSITRSGSTVRIAAEFRHSDINFAADEGLSATNGRALAKAMGRKLPAVADRTPLLLAPAEVLAAVDTLEQQ
jgi:hypothetical protein